MKNTHFSDVNTGEKVKIIIIKHRRKKISTNKTHLYIVKIVIEFTWLKSK